MIQQSPADKEVLLDLLNAPRVLTAEVRPLVPKLVCCFNIALGKC